MLAAYSERQHIPDVSFFLFEKMQAEGDSERNNLILFISEGMYIAQCEEQASSSMRRH